jgi:hypothetical protein
VRGQGATPTSIRVARLEALGVHSRPQGLGNRRRGLTATPRRERLDACAVELTEQRTHSVSPSLLERTKVAVGLKLADAHRGVRGYRYGQRSGAA